MTLEKLKELEEHLARRIYGWEANLPNILLYDISVEFDLNLRPDNRRHVLIKVPCEIDNIQEFLFCLVEIELAERALSDLQAFEALVRYLEERIKNAHKDN